jgi:hypothetical protein
MQRWPVAVDGAFCRTCVFVSRPLVIPAAPSGPIAAANGNLSGTALFPIRQGWSVLQI